MTSQGSPYARFRRALLSGDPHISLAAARELPQLSLPDGLELVGVLGAAGDHRYGAAAVRWLSRWCIGARPRLEEPQAAVAALSRLPQDHEGALMALRPLTGGRRG